MIYKYMKKYTAKRKYQKNKTRKSGGSNNNNNNNIKARSLRRKKAIAWVHFVIQHAQRHGWERFPVKSYKPESIKYNGNYVFENSIDEIHPTGKKFTFKDAMSLSKYYWDSNRQEGKRPDLYQQFQEAYELL